MLLPGLYELVVVYVVLCDLSEGGRVLVMNEYGDACESRTERACSCASSAGG